MNTISALHRRRPALWATSTALTALALAACGGAAGDARPDPARAAGEASEDTATDDVPAAAEERDDHEHQEHDQAGESGEGDGHAPGEPADDRQTAESAGPSPRLGVTYDGGVMVLDAMTLEVVGDFEAEGFTRLNPAGDGRHLLLTEASSFRLLDTGAWSEPHGDHDHSYTTDPLLTDLRFEADHPGHVVVHGDRTVLFADGTGEVQAFDPGALDGQTLPDVEQLATPEAHHGVAVLLSDGSLLHTIGDEESRPGAVVIDAAGQEIARSEDCPGVHGETVAAGEAVLLGCEDGVLVYRDGGFVKVDAEHEYARIGNVAGHHASSVVLGDYKTDAEAELERPTTVSLVDTEEERIDLVELPASYSFRSLGRGPDGEALVLGTDGALRVLDEETGAVTAEIPVVSAWEEPTEWQDPRPALFVLGDLAYVSEPAEQQLHIVDLRTDRVIDSGDLPEVPNELSGVTG